MKTQFNWFGTDWRRVKNHCRTTDNKAFTEKDASETFKKKLLISEHTPMFDDEIGDTDKLKKALKLYYGDHIPKDINQATDKIMWFYRCGKEETQKTRRRKRSGSSERYYDFDHDDAYIYSAFLQQFGVDLQDEDLHWWKFKAMFQSLSEDTEFVKIMGYRSIKITQNMTKSQKDFYLDMKRIHALPLPKTEVDKIKAIEAALMNGGNVSALLKGR